MEEGGKVTVPDVNVILLTTISTIVLGGGGGGAAPEGTKKLLAVP
jgi:hypothetical protein